MKKRYIYILVLILSMLLSKVVYAANTGSTTITSEKTITAEASDIVQLCLTLKPNFVTKIVTSQGTYTNLNSSTVMYCKTGTKVTLYQSSSRNWDFWDVNDTSHYLGRGAACSFYVPSSPVSYSANFEISDSSINGSYSGIHLTFATGWMRQITAYLGT